MEAKYCGRVAEKLNATMEEELGRVGGEDNSMVEMEVEVSDSGPVIAMTISGLALADTVHWRLTRRSRVVELKWSKRLSRDKSFIKVKDNPGIFGDNWGCSLLINREGGRRERGEFIFLFLFSHSIEIKEGNMENKEILVNLWNTL